MESVFRDCVARVPGRRTLRCCSPATSSRRSSTCATGSASSGRAGASSRDPRRAAAPDPHVDHGRPRVGARTASTRLPGVHDLVRSTDHRVQLEVDTTRLDRGAGRAAERRGPRLSPASRRRSRTSSCATTATGSAGGGGRREVTGTLAFLRAFIRRDRWLYLWWGVGVCCPLRRARPGASTASTRPRPSSTGPQPAMEGNAALVAMAGPARALNTTGGQVTWQAAALRRHLRRADEHVHRRPAHPRRGGERTRRAAARCAGRTVSRPMTAALLDAMIANVVLGALVAGSLAAYGLAVADSPGSGRRADPHRLVLHRHCSRRGPADRQHAGRRTDSQGRDRASPYVLRARSGT